MKNFNRREFIKLSRKINKNDNLVIFYAGHGNYDKKTEKGYWMPSNSNRDFEENIILNTSIVTYIKAIPSKGNPTAARVTVSITTALPGTPAVPTEAIVAVNAINM